MTHVVTRACCNDAACANVCPVNCIHPTPDEPEYQTAELLYIDPNTCIDCGACVEVCPVDAIVADVDLKPSDQAFISLSTHFFRDFRYPRMGFVEPPPIPSPPPAQSTLRLAVIGTGPAAVFAVESVLEATGGNVDVNVFERLPTPWGLIRSGVAPDHQDTKQIIHSLERIATDPRVSVHLDTAVGQAVSHEELMSSHHAVLYATGAPDGRKLAVHGEALPNSASAADFVAWYNGHPDVVDFDIDLSGSRAVIIGNGNVALDVARILVSDPDQLAAHSDIAEHALTALRASNVREVVVLGRRGPEQAAFTTPELLALLATDTFDVRVDPTGLADYASSDQDFAPKSALLRDLLTPQPSVSGRSIVLRFLASPVEILGTEQVSGIRIANSTLVDGHTGEAVASPTGVEEVLPCSLVVSAVGYRGRPIGGLPFDERNGAFHHNSGRVTEPDGRPVRGVYAAGWIKRGPSGVIGSNRSCARETISSLMHDFWAGLLPDPSQGTEEFRALLRSRHTGTIGLDGWRAIDSYERALGKAAGRPRVKLVNTREMRNIATESW